jgi:photosystem II stability/assembly factor-like uncharacterized protein
MLSAPAILALALAMSACSSDAELPPGAQDGGAVTGHVHNLAYDGPTLVLGTHDGLWEQESGAVPVQVSQETFDVMGLALSGSTWFASGHPGPGMDAPADLGLMASTDSGVTWRNVSLSGEVDFHRLTAAGDVVLGQSAHDQKLLRSEDAGLTWQDLGAPPVFDIAMNPSDDTRVLATTEQGLLASQDGGRSFTAVPESPVLMFAVWAEDAVYGVSASGEVYSSADQGLSWASVGSVPGQPIALGAAGERIAILVDDVIWESPDGGGSFAARIANLGGH